MLENDHLGVEGATSFREPNKEDEYRHEVTECVLELKRLIEGDPLQVNPLQLDSEQERLLKSVIDRLQKVSVKMHQS